jgi:cob(I)alamin adenosyltransferase
MHSVTTKAGDDGRTDFPALSERTPKDHPAIELMGTMDELQAFLADAALELEPARQALIKCIEGDLSKAMGFLAVGYGFDPAEGAAFLEARIAELEQLPLPGGFTPPPEKRAAIKLNLARTICRRCERRTVTAHAAAILPWLNRLSDLLYLLSIT